MTTRQAAALTEELIMHIEDLLDNAGDEGLSGEQLRDEDTNEVVGVVTELIADMVPNTFRVKLADGTMLRVSVEVA